MLEYVRNKICSTGQLPHFALDNDGLFFTTVPMITKDSSLEFSGIEEISPDVFMCVQPLSGISIHRYRDTPMPSITFKKKDFSKDYFSEEEIARINSFKLLKKQLEWAAGRAAIKNILEMKGIDAKSAWVDYYEKGAPFLSGMSEFPLSISHSGKYAVAMISFSGTRCAVDIERITKKERYFFMDISFSEEERAWANDDPEKIYTVWTVKESFLKYIGLGFHENLMKVIYRDDSVYFEGNPANVSIIHKNFDSYCCTICLGA